MHGPCSSVPDRTPVGDDPRTLSRQSAVLLACAALRAEDDPIAAELTADAGRLSARASAQFKADAAQLALVNAELKRVHEDMSQAVQQLRIGGPRATRRDPRRERYQLLLDDYNALLELGLELQRRLYQ